MTAIDLKVLFDLQERLEEVVGEFKMPKASRVVLEWAEAHGMLPDRDRVINELAPRQRPGTFEMFERLKRSYAPKVYGYDLAATDPDPAPQGAAPATDPAAPPSGTEEGTLPPDDADAVESAGGGNEIPAGPQASDGKPEPKAARDLNAVADRPEEDKAPKDAERTTLDVASGPGDAGPGPSAPKAGASWTDEEDARAIELRQRGMMRKDIAEALGRPLQSVKFRFSKKLNAMMDSETAGKPAPEGGAESGVTAAAQFAENAPAGAADQIGIQKAPVVHPPAAPKPAPKKAVTVEASINGALNALGYKRPWTALMDHDLAQDFGNSRPLAEIAADFGLDARVIKDRWNALKSAADGNTKALVAVLELRAEAALIKAAE